MKDLKKEEEKEKKRRRRSGSEGECVYLNETYNPVSGKTMRQWSTAGQRRNTNSTHVTCLCNHLLICFELVSSVESVGRVVTQLGSDTIDQKAVQIWALYLSCLVFSRLVCSRVLLATRVKPSKTHIDGRKVECCFGKSSGSREPCPPSPTLWNVQL